VNSGLRESISFGGPDADEPAFRLGAGGRDDVLHLAVDPSAACGGEGLDAVHHELGLPWESEAFLDVLLAQRMDHEREAADVAEVPGRMQQGAARSFSSSRISMKSLVGDLSCGFASAARIIASSVPRRPPLEQLRRHVDPQVHLARRLKKARRSSSTAEVISACRRGSTAGRPPSARRKCRR